MLLNRIEFTLQETIPLLQQRGNFGDGGDVFIGREKANGKLAGEKGGWKEFVDRRRRCC